MDRILFFLSAMRWQDMADIILNSYLLFRLYVLFRGTNAIRVIVGMAFLWFVQQVSVSLGLILTSWVSQGIIAVGALILIVVFRKEIRSILQGKNLRAIFWSLPGRAARIPAEILAESAFEMARRRVGALIVLPGDEDLHEAVHGGIPWQGRMSKEMILSIFWPENPVHDGAAIVQGDQVTEVGAVMPLSRREDLPSCYGTRHRAAAGLAEATDALVITVSEERGEVSVAKGPEFRCVQDPDELRGLLESHAGDPSKAGGRSGRERLEFVAAAALSLLLVGGTWFSFTQGQDTLITLEIPIEYMNRDPGMEILDASHTMVSLELSGSGTLIRSIRPEQVKARLDLAAAIAGKNAFPVRPENISLPPGIALKDIKPAAVEVVLDVLTRRELPLQVDWVGRLREGLIITEVRLDPERVQVTGLRSTLEKTATIYTEKVPVDQLDKPGTFTVKIVLNPPTLKVAGGSRERVTVEFVVRERVQE
ncbi:MAG: diadenylate cyclase [Thermodesulfobacteriota bacterium]